MFLDVYSDNTTSITYEEGKEGATGDSNERDGEPEKKHQAA